MFNGITTFLVSAGVVTLAEMGDKTQLLAMCFATRYKASKVLIGVFLATVINHALAVAAGVFLKQVLSSYSLAIQVVASLSFIGFALWTIKGDKVDDSCDSRNPYGPIITVAIAFFIAEMGDKTQLTTVSLASGLQNPVSILMGTTTGMLIADGIGIIFGVVMNKKIPEKKLKMISAVIFAICGIAGYIQAAVKFMDILPLIASLVVIIAVTFGLAYYIIRNNPNDGVYEEIATMNDKKAK